ncbi:MAG: extracellular solute-binding protein [Geminicoccaceae bacterium]|nr:extracellular solute-binding protein [Geminicoccaceae bacterium]
MTFVDGLARGSAGLVAVLTLMSGGVDRADAADAVQMISHRYPALEFYAERMKEAIEGVEVNTQLMPHDKAMELATIALSSKADTVDILYLNDSTFLSFAKNGWLRPLDDLFEKYKEEFNLGDFADSALDTFRYDGKLYVLPHTINTQLFFYRKDLLDEAGKEPPTSFEEYGALAAELNSPLRAGTISCLKPVDAALNEMHWYLNGLGGQWFDGDMRPVFNNEAGVAAFTRLKEITANAQRGFTSAANDECTIALQQDTAYMGMQWASRAAAMDDPTKSNVVGKIDWVAPPDGHQRIAADGYAISAFSSQDPDTLFRIIATSSDEANMREAASMILPPRRSVLNDPELQKINRHYPASLASLEIGEAFPRLPEFYEVGEFITRRVLQGVTGEMDMQEALDAAAEETTQLLTSRGYYKQ